MSISAIVTLTSNLHVTGVVNLLPGSGREDGADDADDAKRAKTRITGEIKGLAKGQSYTINVAQVGDLGNVKAGPDGAAKVHLNSPIGLNALIGRTLGVHAGNSSTGERVAWGEIKRTA